MNELSQSSYDSYEVESFKPPDIVLEVKSSQSDDSSQVIQSEMYLDGLEEIRTPFDYIFQNRSILPVEMLLEDLESETASAEKSFCKKLFTCFKQKNDIKLLRNKVITLARTVFDHEIEHHGNIIMTWYHEVTGRRLFKLEQKIWQKIGFINDDTKTNGLKQPGLVLVLMHFLYLKKKQPDLMQVFWSCCLNPNTSGNVVSAALSILKVTIEMFESSEMTRYLASSSEGVFSIFFMVQGKMIELWCQEFELAREKSNFDLITKSTRNKIKKLSQLFQS